ncbi:MAG: nucleotidyltransferase family protein [Steroidobacteraceae bacterium]
MKTLTALVLAGTRAGGDPLASGAGVSHKALIAIAGRAMIEHVVQALDAVPEIGRIVIAIERPEVLDALPGLREPACHRPVSVVAAAEGPSASVASVLAREGVPLLVTTADHPLLRPEWIRSFLDATPADADATLALASRGSVMAAVPDTRRTWLRFVEGEYSGCNLFLLRRPAATGIVELWRQLEMDRKRPLRLMLRLGIGFALRYGLGWLRLDQALAKLGRASGARVAVVELADGHAAIDVDKPDDLELVRRLMGGTTQG